MPGLILAAVTSDNARGGYYWTFLFPMLLFIVAGAILYVILFSRPHARVPARRILPVQGGAPEHGAARAAAVAGGRSAACGGGTAELDHEPHGALREAQVAADKVAEPGGGDEMAAPGEAAGHTGADGTGTDGTGTDGTGTDSTGTDGTGTGTTEGE